MVPVGLTALGILFLWALRILEDLRCHPCSPEGRKLVPGCRRGLHWNVSLVVRNNHCDAFPASWQKMFLFWFLRTIYSRNAICDTHTHMICAFANAVRVLRLNVSVYILIVHDLLYINYPKPLTLRTLLHWKLVNQNSWWHVLRKRACYCMDGIHLERPLHLCTCSAFVLPLPQKQHYHFQLPCWHFSSIFIATMRVVYWSCVSQN